MQQQNNVIGIDLGTTFSVVAHLDHTGRPVTIPSAAGELTTPTAIFFDGKTPIVGREALQAAPMDPDHSADCIKRDIGNPHYRRSIGGEQFPPEVLSGYILRALVQNAERKLGTIDGAVITVPAYFGEARRQATLTAGQLAGINVLDLINEPTAAAIAYGYQEGFLVPGKAGGMNSDTNAGHRILVYDLGGGTFDVSIVELRGQDLRVIGTDGDAQLGGRDWDDRLLDHLAEQIRSSSREDPRNNPGLRHELLSSVEVAKRTLSEREQATVYFNHLGERQRLQITRETFEELTRTLLERTRTTTQLVVMQTGLSWTDIDRVLLVGGATRMTMVQQMLADLTGQAPSHSAAVDEAVAHGAALYASLIASHRLTQAGAQPAAESVATAAAPVEFSITDVNSHSLGIEGLDRQTKQHVNQILIPKNSALPCSVKKVFATAKDDQRSVVIRVLEGETERMDACSVVGTCHVRDLPPKLPAATPVTVHYTFDTAGTLSVSAAVAGTDARVETEFVRDASLSRDDILRWGQRLRTQASL